MDNNYIINYIIDNFQDINLLNSWGEKSFFLNPGHKLKRGTYFATLKEKDSNNDKASFLNRPDVYRLNIGVDKNCYLSYFPKIPKRPKKGGIIEGNYDFHKLDIILPHPVYGWMGWVCILNPSTITFQECKFLLDNSYAKALQITIKKLQK